MGPGEEDVPTKVFVGVGEATTKVFVGVGEATLIGDQKATIAE
jgi:hypothetical protein